MTREYKGYKITKVTRNDWLVSKDDRICLTPAGRVPRTLKEAKELIDRRTTK